MRPNASRSTGREGPASDPWLSVVIPAYREAARILTSLQRITEFLDEQDYPWECVVVDDGSPDETAAIVETYIREHPGFPVRLLREPHRGKGAAVRAGILDACGEFILFSDADLSTPIEEVKRFLPLLEAGHDVVIGSREAAGARRYNEPYHRHIVGRVFNFVVRTLAVRGYQDTQCGFKAYRKAAARRLFGRQRLDRFSFDVEVLFLARKSGLKVAVVPVQWYYADFSNMNILQDGFLMFTDVLRVRLNELRGLYR
jgi:glycosyltransferase involved in cell wall biosynthesis